MHSTWVQSRAGRAPVARHSTTEHANSVSSKASVSRQQLFHHLAGHVRQPEIAALEAIGQFQMIEAKQMQDRRVEVVDVDWVFDHTPTEIVRLADDLSALD